MNNIINKRSKDNTEESNNIKSENEVTLSDILNLFDGL